MKRVKRRYVALAIDSPEACGLNEFIDAVRRSVSKLYGEYGASKTNLSLISFDDERKLAVIRVGHSGLELIKTALASITRIGNKPAAVRILRVSGTLKSLHQKTR